MENKKKYEECSIIIKFVSLDIIECSNQTSFDGEWDYVDDTFMS